MSGSDVENMRQWKASKPRKIGFGVVRLCFSQSSPASEREAKVTQMNLQMQQKSRKKPSGGCAGKTTNNKMPNNFKPKVPNKHQPKTSVPTQYQTGVVVVCCCVVLCVCVCVSCVCCRLPCFGKLHYLILGRYWY